MAAPEPTYTVFTVMPGWAALKAGITTFFMRPASRTLVVL